MFALPTFLGFNGILAAREFRLLLNRLFHDLTISQMTDPTPNSIPRYMVPLLLEDLLPLTVGPPEDSDLTDLSESSSDSDADAAVACLSDLLARSSESSALSDADPDIHQPTLRTQAKPAADIHSDSSALTELTEEYEFEIPPTSVTAPVSGSPSLEEDALCTAGLLLRRDAVEGDDSEDGGYEGDTDGSSLGDSMGRKRKRRRARALPKGAFDVSPMLWTIGSQPPVHSSDIAIPPTPPPLPPPSHAPPSGAYTAPTTGLHQSAARKAKAKERSRVKKKQKRAALSEARCERLPSPTVVTIDLPVEKLEARAAQGNFVGRGGACAEEIPTADEALAMGYKRIEWDGRCVLVLSFPHAHAHSAFVSQPTPRDC